MRPGRDALLLLRAELLDSDASSARAGCGALLRCVAGRRHERAGAGAAHTAGASGTRGALSAWGRLVSRTPVSFSSPEFVFLPRRGTSRATGDSAPPGAGEHH